MEFQSSAHKTIPNQLVLLSKLSAKEQLVYVNLIGLKVVQIADVTLFLDVSMKVLLGEISF